jgi:hypothetical protein
MAINNNEHGSTMLETILYICVLIALGTTLAQGAARVFHRYNVGRASQQVIDLKKTILMFTAADEDYTRVSNENLINANAVPIDMKNLRHALGGEIIVGCASDYENAKDDSEAINKYMYFITFKDISQGPCTEIITQGQFFSAGSEVDTYIINNTYWKYKKSLFNKGDIPSSKELSHQHLSIEQALNACSKKKNNTITWIFS